MKTEQFAMYKYVEGYPIFQYLAMVTGTLNILCCGMNYGWTSPTLPKLLAEDSYIPTTGNEGSWIAVVICFGGMVGSIIGGSILNRIGRKNVVLLSSFPFFIAWIMIAFATSVPVLLIARLIGGIADGIIYSGIPMYLGEISDPSIRGFLGSFISVVWILGILLMNIIGTYLSITNAALIASLVPVLLLITFSWMPESPYYLIMKGNFKEAKRSLKIFKGPDGIDKELERLTRAVEEQNSNKGSFFDLFKAKNNRRALCIMMGTRAAQQITGTTAFMFYAQIIFEDAGDIISPSVSSIIYFGVQFLLCGLSSAIVDKAGRRPLMIISLSGSALVLFVEGIYFFIKEATDIDVSNFDLVPIIALIVYVIVFSVGMQTIPVLLISEIFATDVKAFAVSFADLYFAVIAAGFSKFFQITKDDFGVYVPFFFFSIGCIFALIFIIFCVPETKGKTLEEIQLELKGENVTK